MECIAFEFVLDFKLERPSSTKSLEIYYADDSSFVRRFAYGNNRKTSVECF